MREKLNQQTAEDLLKELTLTRKVITETLDNLRAINAIQSKYIQTLSRFSAEGLTKEQECSLRAKIATNFRTIERNLSDISKYATFLEKINIKHLK